jgi:hypothetical protein
MYNVTENQINEAIESIFDILQLEPDLGDDFYRVLINWLDNNDIEVIED